MGPIGPRGFPGRDGLSTTGGPLTSTGLGIPPTFNANLSTIGMENSLLKSYFIVYVTPSTSRSVAVLGILYSLTVNERLEWIRELFPICTVNPVFILIIQITHHERLPQGLTEES